MSSHRVLSVGQCNFDHAKISGSLRRFFQAEVEPVATHEEAIDALRSQTYELVLVNRVGDEDGSSGLDLIRMMKSQPAMASVPVMLVSNYPDAQQQAVALGALRGFGKADLDRQAPACLATVFQRVGIGDQ